MNEDEKKKTTVHDRICGMLAALAALLVMTGGAESAFAKPGDLLPVWSEVPTMLGGLASMGLVCLIPYAVGLVLMRLIRTEVLKEKGHPVILILLAVVLAFAVLCLTHGILT